MTVKMKGVSWASQGYPLNITFILSWVSQMDGFTKCSLTYNAPMLAG